MTLRLDRRLVTILLVAAVVIVVLAAALIYGSLHVDGGSGGGTAPAT